MFVGLSGDAARAAECTDTAMTLIGALIGKGKNLSPNSRAKNYVGRVLAERDHRFTLAEYEIAVETLEGLTMLAVESYQSNRRECQRYILPTYSEGRDGSIPRRLTVAARHRK